jgi:hypothetical protein
VTTDPKPEQTAPRAGVKRLRASLTDAGSAARRRLRRFRGGADAAADATPAPEGVAIADDIVVEAEPAQRTGIGLWRAISRAKLALVIVVALVQVVLALISWRIRGSRARRRGNAGEDDALEAIGETLGGLAGSVDASLDA